MSGEINNLNSPYGDVPLENRNSESYQKPNSKDNKESKEKENEIYKYVSKDTIDKFLTQNKELVYRTIKTTINTIDRFNQKLGYKLVKELNTYLFSSSDDNSKKQLEITLNKRTLTEQNLEKKIKEFVDNQFQIIENRFKNNILKRLIKDVEENKDYTKLFINFKLLNDKLIDNVKFEIVFFFEFNIIRDTQDKRKIKEFNLKIVNLYIQIDMFFVKKPNSGYGKLLIELIKEIGKSLKTQDFGIEFKNGKETYLSILVDSPIYSAIPFYVKQGFKLIIRNYKFLEPFILRDRFLSQIIELYKPKRSKVNLDFGHIDYSNCLFLSIDVDKVYNIVDLNFMDYMKLEELFRKSESVLITFV